MSALDWLFNWRSMEAARPGQWALVRFVDDSLVALRIGTRDLPDALEWTPLDQVLVEHG